MSLETFDKKIIVATDRMKLADAVKLSQRLRGLVWGMKIRLPLLLDSIWAIQDLKANGMRIMMDPKCFDIESSMVDDISTLAAKGVDLITVHATAGSRRLKACVKACEGTTTRLLAVTCLTDSDDEDLIEAYGAFRQHVLPPLYQIVVESGVHGVVCGFPDIPLLRPAPSLIVCPGFRPPGTAVNEQQVVGGYEEALLASLVVVGRPITQATDPVKAVEEMNRGFTLAAKVVQKTVSPDSQEVKKDEPDDQQLVVLPDVQEPDVGAG